MTWKGLVRRIPFSKNEDRADTVYKVNGLYFLFFSVSENKNSVRGTNCKDKIATKACIKLKKKGKCGKKKTWKKCMETCQKCTSGIIEEFSTA